MPSHRPQAAHARWSSATALMGAGDPSRGVSFRRTATVCRKCTPHLWMSSAVFSIAKTDASANRAAATSERSVGKGTIWAGWRMFVTIGASYANSGRPNQFCNQVQAAPPPSGLGLGRAVETRASLARTGAATALYRSSRPHYRNHKHGVFFGLPIRLWRLARWAALGCDQTSRHSFATMGAGAFTLQRPSSSVQARAYQAGSFASIFDSLGYQDFSVSTDNSKRLQVILTSQANTPDRFAKESVGGFHRSSLINTPSLEAC